MAYTDDWESLMNGVLSGIVGLTFASATKKWRSAMSISGAR